ncbi:hypothetical protein EX895_005514 [Sporisorium graminicola]|uniref:CSC1/OSCA1-like 7TM region domain-containing protein n=1 Tax=Sporisorium graminicola TaxID=280036 RepID=A0A4U7KQT3_9BASI|nr:hypothetical protein EX895_005514 [Sporisorium graminicola]TKY85352.1 hypothetical protein EX895_005514 [Sporisorium graminicola]
MTDAPQVPFDLYTYTRSGATAAAVATSTTAATFFNTGIGWQNDVSGGDGNNGSGDNPAIPLPNQRAFEGPWFSQQLSLSIFIGVVSFFIFVIVRRRNAALFAPRTKLKGFSPLDDGHDSGYFGWIMPTLKTEEMRILQTVGLDAAILLSFLKMGFWLFFSLSCWSILVLMPVNYWQNGVLDGVSPAEDRDNATDPNAIRDTVTGVWTQLLASSLRKKHDPPQEPLPQLPLPAKPAQAQLYHATHLLSAYLVTLLAMRAIWVNYQRFVRSRQLYILEILESIPARTVEIRDLPVHLRDEKALAEYFENMDMPVESTAVVRKTEGLSRLLNQRSKALQQLEKTWVQWLGNPTDAEGYDPEKIMLLAAGANHEDIPSSSVTDDLVRISVDDDRTQRDSRDDQENTRLLGGTEYNHVFNGADTIRTHRPRPTLRKQWWNPFSEKVDGIDELTRQFNAVDRAVRRRRKVGRFPGGNVGFVTFESAASAQIASQTVHYPMPAYCATSMAQEPRDIIWSNIDLSNNDRRVRQVLVSIFMIAVLVFYVPPLVFLASFVSPGAIKKYAPWLDRLLGTDQRLRALVQNNLPSLVVIGFNALLPLVLEYSSYLQGLKARSLVEYSLLKKYYLFLMVSVVFIFLVATTAWGVLQELAENPMRVIDKLAASLPRARFFSLSYVILQGIALQPLQLLQLPTLILRGFYRLFLTRTPREFAELNAPPTLAMGNVYPQALLIFTLCILYSIVSPLIVIFGAIYFGIAYVVNKYKLLYVFYKPYESQGQAWPISASRCIWALVLFHIFQFSLFSVRKELWMSSGLLPLIVFTFWFNGHLETTFGPLTHHVNLSSVVEVLKEREVDPGVAELAQNGPPALARAEVAGGEGVVSTDPSAVSAAANGGSSGVRSGSMTPSGSRSKQLLSLDPSHKIDPEFTKLALARYSHDEQDDTLFVAQRDTKTDYREPPGAGYYPGVLNTGRRRYGHPAITGILPELWLPIPSQRLEEGGEDVTAPDDLEANATGMAPATTSALGAPLRGDDRAAEAGSPNNTAAARIRARALSKAEPLILSLRKRKSSLMSGPRPRHASPSSTQRHFGDEPSVDRGSSPAPPAPDADTDFGVWSDGVSGPQGSSSSAAVGEALSGGYAVAPARSHLRAARMESDEQGVDGEEGEVDDEAEEGVYIHRTASRKVGGGRRRKVSGVPGVSSYHD